MKRAHVNTQYQKSVKPEKWFGAFFGLSIGRICLLVKIFKLSPIVFRKIFQ